MTYQDLGFNQEHEKYRIEQHLDSFEIGRISVEHKERYILRTPTDEFDAELIGNLRFTAQSSADFPAVGDWVAFSEYDEGKALIHAIYPRLSMLQRQAVGKSGQTQIIAANIDFGLIVQAVDRDFNINRLQRYLTICHASRVEPIIVLSKIDLIKKADLQTIQEQIEARVDQVPILAVSNQDNAYGPLEAFIQKGKTYCLLGSSGVGKSTLLNGLLGKEQMKTSELSASLNKGRHTTSHRELIVLDSGAILIDNPGMREIGMTDATQALETTFDSINQFTQNCRYKDCTHTNVNGCAVLEALDNGDIDKDSYINYRKMQKEQMHFESDVQERKKKDKDFGRMIKNVQKQRKNRKY